MFLSERRKFPQAPCLPEKKNLMTACVSMLLKWRASPDMLPFSLCNKKRLAIRHMNRPLFPTTLSIPSYDIGKYVGLRTYQHSHVIPTVLEIPRLILCSLILEGLLFYPEDCGSRFPQNVGTVYHTTWRHMPEYHILNILFLLAVIVYLGWNVFTIYLWYLPTRLWATRWRSWLRHCATGRKVAGSIPDGVVGIFHWNNPSGRTVALGSTQPLTEMSTRNISWGVKVDGV